MSDRNHAVHEGDLRFSVSIWRALLCTLHQKEYNSTQRPRSQYVQQEWS